MYYLIFILIASSLWNIIEHIVLDTAEVIKIQGINYTLIKPNHISYDCFGSLRKKSVSSTASEMVMTNYKTTEAK